MSFYDYKHTFSYPKSSPKIVVLKASNSSELESGCPDIAYTGISQGIKTRQFEHRLESSPASRNPRF